MVNLPLSLPVWYSTRPVDDGRESREGEERRWAERYSSLNVKGPREQEIEDPVNSVSFPEYLLDRVRPLFDLIKKEEWGKGKVQRSSLSSSSSSLLTQMGHQDGGWEDTGLGGGLWNRTQKPIIEEDNRVFGIVSLTEGNHYRPSSKIEDKPKSWEDRGHIDKGT